MPYAIRLPIESSQQPLLGKIQDLGSGHDQVIQHPDIDQSNREDLMGSVPEFESEIVPIGIRIGQGVGIPNVTGQKSQGCLRFNASRQSHFGNHLNFRTDIAFVQNIFLDLVDDGLEGVGLAHIEHVFHTQKIIFHLG